MPEYLKYAMASLFRNRLIGDSNFKRYYRLLEMRETLPQIKIEEYQFKELKRILIHSYKNVPYYRELFDKSSFDPFKFSSFEEMEKIPLLDKTIIRENFDRLISKEPVRNGSYVATTGGSTGEPLKVLLDYDSIFKENAFIYHFRKKLGYKFEDRLFTFRGIEFGNKFWKYNPMYNELIVSPFKLSKIILEKYVAKYNDFNPQYINGYLSSIYFFAKLLSENPIPIKARLKGIFLISENIDIGKREFIENVFKVKSITHYGHSERCILAEEKMPNQYWFDPYYGYTEQVKMNDNRFVIVGTGFLNFTMPLIRYKTDDICSYQNGYFHIEGRWKSLDGLYGKNDEFFAHAAFNFHSSIFRNVTNYQFVQQKKGEADLLLIVNSDFKDSEIGVMEKEISKKTDGVIDFNIKVVPNLILSPRGKFQMFLSKLTDDNNVP
jgi:phenylacetate-CoA ligase